MSVPVPVAGPILEVLEIGQPRLGFFLVEVRQHRVGVFSVLGTAQMCAGPVVDAARMSAFLVVEASFSNGSIVVEQSFLSETGC